MTTPTPYPPAAPQAPRQCIVCGQAGTLQPRTEKITRKRRVKFGLTFVLLTLLGGLGIVLWLIWPRRTETVNVDRYVVCTACGARQA